MGWTSTHLYRGQSIKDYFETQFTCESKEVSYRVLDSSLVRFHTWYAAIEKINHVSNEREVFAVVVLVNTSPRSEYNLHYKDMDETMGPGNCECPERILNLLTPTTNKYALQWRQECRKNTCKPKKPPLKEGLYVLLDKPASFKGGETFRLLKVANPRKRWFTPPNGKGGYYCIPNTQLRKMKYITLDLDNIPYDELPAYIGKDQDINRWIQERINQGDHTAMA